MAGKDPVYKETPEKAIELMAQGCATLFEISQKLSAQVATLQRWLATQSSKVKVHGLDKVTNNVVRLCTVSDMAIEGEISQLEAAQLYFMITSADLYEKIEALENKLELLC